MTRDEQIYVATKAFAKGWDFEEMKYSDDMYGNEQYADEVHIHVVDIEVIGTLQFREKYPNVKMFPGF